MWPYFNVPISSFGPHSNVTLSEMLYLIHLSVKMPCLLLSFSLSPLLLFFFPLPWNFPPPVILSILIINLACLPPHSLLLLLLSRFSRVRLCATPKTAAHQAPPFLGFSRQEHWSGLPFPSPMHESESEVAQSCLTLSNPMDCSPPSFSVHGIFQARVLEWGAIAFSAT